MTEILLTVLTFSGWALAVYQFRVYAGLIHDLRDLAENNRNDAVRYWCAWAYGVHPDTVDVHAVRDWLNETGEAMTTLNNELRDLGIDPAKP